MSVYTPDRWIIIKITHNGKSHERVFAGWYGGYCGSDSWKMNSGIVSTELKDDVYSFKGDSGSVYHCHKGCYGMSNYMRSVLANFMDQNTETTYIEVVDFLDE